MCAKYRTLPSGLTFPGGHIEPGENVVASVIREVREETGLSITDVVPAGYIQWYNPDRQSQYFVFLFKTSSYSGKLEGSAEGNVKWMTLEEMLAGPLAPNMKQYLAVFQNEDIPQAYGVSGKELQLLKKMEELNNMSSQSSKVVTTNDDHGLVAENFINELCNIRFFKDFVVRSPKYSNSGGEKEVSDVLVIFNDIMLNIQVKSKIEDKPFSQKNETDIKRIEKKITKGIEQLKELTSVLNNKKVNSFKTERGITIPLIGQNFRKIGIVCLSLSGEERLPIDEQTNLKMYCTDRYDHEIHCFKNEVFKCILDELTTLPDFLRYLEYRKIFLKNEAIVPLTKELDFLAFYKSRYPEVKRGASEIKEGKKFFLVLEENLWENYLSHTEELKQRSEDDQVSRWFDYLIETKSESIGFKATKNAVPGSEESYWQIICQLAKLDRLQRRAFSEQCLKKAILADNSPRGYNYCLIPFPELKIAFVYVAYRSTNREKRRELLQVLCESAAVTMKKSTLIITQILGIATENFSSEFHSDDMLLADAEGLIESLPADSPLFNEKNNFFAPMSQTKVFEFRQNK